jgi:hypothetical protein
MYISEGSHPNNWTDPKPPKLLVLFYKTILLIKEIYTSSTVVSHNLSK